MELRWLYPKFPEDDVKPVLQYLQPGSSGFGEHKPPEWKNVPYVFDTKEYNKACPGFTENT